MKFKYYVCVFTLNRQLQEKLIDEAHKLGYTNCMVNTEGEEYWTKFYRIGNITTFTQQMKELENYYYFNLDTNPELFEAVLGIIAIREDEEYCENEYFIVNRDNNTGSVGNIHKISQVRPNCLHYKKTESSIYFSSWTKDYIRKATPEEIIAHFSKLNKTEKVEEFVLPEKWCINRNKSNYKVINGYFNLNRKAEFYDVTKGYIHSDIVESGDNSYTSSPSGRKHPDFKEITFEQFQKHVLNKPRNMENKKLIGYKLIKPEYLQAALKITKLSRDTQEYLEQMIRENLPDSSTVDKLREAGVLDLWFEPVYKEDKKLPAINSYSGKMEGDYIIYGNNCAKFHKDFFTALNMVDKNLTGQNREIQSIKLDSGVEITMKQVKEIIEFIEQNEKSC